jgi:DNA (cytosine-5)-methyltransferase 1
MTPVAGAGPLTAVSLFAGIGGLDLACQRAGIEVRAAVEMDPGCRAVLARHFPGTALFDDVTEVTGDQLRTTGFVPRRGVLAAGWPCQGNSVAGRRGGLADPRSGLWRHVVRLLAETRPRWFLGENVHGLLSVRSGRDFAAVVRDLDDLGYGVAWRVLDAQWFGVPQRRRRVFLAGCLGDPCRPVQVLLEPESGGGHPAQSRQAPANVAGTLGSRAGGSRTTDLDGHGAYVASTLQGGGQRGHRVDAEGAAGGHLLPVPVAVRGRDGGSRIEAGQPGDPAFTLRTPGDGSSYPMVAYTLTGERFDASEDGTGHGTPLVFAPLTAGTAAGPGVNPPGRRVEDDTNLVALPVQDGRAVDKAQHGAGLGSPGDPSYTLDTTGAQSVATTAAVRRLTPRECERLQGFPDDWTRWLADGTEQSDSARYRELGNAVAVPVAAWITGRLAAAEAGGAARSTIEPGAAA